MICYGASCSQHKICHENLKCLMFSFAETELLQGFSPYRAGKRYRQGHLGTRDLGLTTWPSRFQCPREPLS